MRGTDKQQSGMFSYLSPEERVPEKHPLRAIRGMTDEVLKGLWAKFNELYSITGRPSIAPEKLLRALLLQILYSVRSERLLMEQLQYNLLFRWFVGLNMDEPVWVATVFSKNRDRLLEGEIARLFFAGVLEQARSADLLSDEHFSVDGTLMEAWAGQKSFQRKDGSEKPPPDDAGNPTVDFHGEKRSNETHESTTDADARLARKSGGHEAKLAYCGNVLIENRNGLVVDAELLAGQWHSGTGCGAADGRADGRQPARDGSCRQGLRHPRVGARDARHERHAARRAERPPTGWKCHGWTHDAAARIQSKSGQAETDRGSIRLVENCGDAT